MLERAAMRDLIHDTTRPMDRLREIMARLRDPSGGCPWDIEQNFASIAPYTIEEAYEVADAIARQDWSDLEGELGDLLLQTVYHAQMAEESGLFDFDTVAIAIGDKMINRHPHVFGEESRDKSAAQQTADWEAIKAQERSGRERRGTLDGIALNLPALTRAEKLQKRLARVGFDWDNARDVIDKIAEEASEVAEAKNQDEREDEIGDLLFAVANLARHLGVDPETALRRTNEKVTRRFTEVERRLETPPAESSLSEMERLWSEIKNEEKTAPVMSDN